MKAVQHSSVSNRSHGYLLQRLMLIWSLVRAIAFVLTCFEWASSPMYAQNSVPVQMILPNCSGWNVVGRVVSADNPNEGIPQCRVLLNGTDVGTITDSKGYYTLLNTMNGRYTLSVISPEGIETGVGTSIIVRGRDIKVPTLTIEAQQYSIIGRVTYTHDRSRGVANVKIRLNAGLTVITDSLGYYAIENVRYNGTYGISVYAHGLTVFGANRTITITQPITRQNFMVESPAIANKINDRDNVADDSLQSLVQQSEVMIGAPRVNTSLTRKIAGK